MQAYTCPKCRASGRNVLAETSEEALLVHLTKECKANPYVDWAEWLASDWYLLGIVRRTVLIHFQPKESDSID